MAISLTALSALGVVEDLRGGVFDRLRSLPIRRTSILFGRIVADLLLVLVAMAGVLVAARVLGWPLGAALPRLLAATGLELLLGTGCACAGTFLGLAVRNTESTASVVPALLFPLTFLSNAFVPTAGLPGWMRWLVEHNPVSTVTGAVRDLLGVPAANGSSVPLAAVLCLLLIAVAAPAAVGACRGTLLPR
jgi:ABC transporter DrrB family efflux protein